MTPRQAQWHTILSGFLAGGFVLGVCGTFAFLATVHWWIPLALVFWSWGFVWHKARYVDRVPVLVIPSRDEGSAAVPRHEQQRPSMDKQWIPDDTQDDDEAWERRVHAMLAEVQQRQVTDMLERS